MEWRTEKNTVAYENAVAFMESRVAGIRSGMEDELVWLIEHPPLYTAGTSAGEGELLEQRFPVYKTGRGGRYTYHGPGQRVAYVMKDLRRSSKQPDIKQYIHNLEEWVIRSLEPFGIRGERRDDKVGIWVVTDAGECKIAAIGVRVRHWVTFHGVAINVSPDLSHFSGIVPCGIRDAGVTSLSKLLGREVNLKEFDGALKETWKKVF